MSLLLTCQILGLLVNRLTADDKYPVLNRDNVTVPIEMQLPQKQNNFFNYCAAFLTSTLNFEYFQKEDDAHRFCISKNTGSKNVVK